MAQLEHPTARGHFTQLLTEIIVAAKVVRNKVALAGIAEVIGEAGEKNVQGETVQILDELANNIMLRRLLHSGLIGILVSEENTDPVYPPEKYYDSEYCVAIDPLDGSSNIACNVPVGTIFGIWKRQSKEGKAPRSDALQSGRHMVCAGYVLYGPSSMLVYTTGTGVHGFTYDPSIGEFILTHPNMKFPEKCKCYSANESYWDWWQQGTRDFIHWVRESDSKTGRPFTARYVGSLVSDFHRNLLYGGVFMYPKDSKDPKFTSGKLRLLYECAPLSFIAENAGGKGSTGEENILDIVPSDIHQRVPLFIGNKREVEKAEEFLKNPSKS
eukprot:TRINITY_DN390_c0_g2_i1.p1 TRINITY_DN390_c0_g2~~TRINITY_DN390_c0_g2_i1.p1  ORF type:complete len:376 (-),score=86.05 TRINITY_DN390_c0_g2_i1:128-1108(-)